MLPLRLYVVYRLRAKKSLKNVDAFSCYKQKLNLTPLNLAHPVVPDSDDVPARNIS